MAQKSGKVPGGSCSRPAAGCRSIAKGPAAAHLFLVSILLVRGCDFGLENFKLRQGILGHLAGERRQVGESSVNDDLSMLVLPVYFAGAAPLLNGLDWYNRPVEVFWDTEAIVVNRVQWQQFAERWLVDAKALTVCRDRGQTERGDAMDPGPLVSTQIDAGARFLAEFQKYAPIQSAFWFKDCEENTWWLYVASDQITDENFDLAYREVVRIAGVLQDPWFDMFLVKVIREQHRLTKAVAELQRRYPGSSPIHLYGKTVGMVTLDEVYVYPLPLAAPVQ